MEDQMECICGEVLKGEQITPEERKAGKKELGNLYRQYQQHMLREDHQSSPAQWAEASKRIEKAKELGKSAKTTER